MKEAVDVAPNQKNKSSRIRSVWEYADPYPGLGPLLEQRWGDIWPPAETRHSYIV